jgi:Cft2 family RNA processing exonuclease/dsRNA-specific ribonuclease
MTRPAVRLTFLGGASEIGASSAIVEVAGTTLLLDAGVRFKPGHQLPDLDALSGKRLDGIVVTHAHSDHTGALPVVHDAFREAPILMTPPTRDLVSVLQRDALRIMQMASEREEDFPLYGERQVESMVERIRPVHHGDSATVGEITVTYLPASHILGASMVHLATPGGNVLFTGDYSVSEQRSVPRFARCPLPVDVVVSEATYGNRLHSDRAAAESRLVRAVGEVLARGGRVLIPAFAIGRAQEVLLLLKDALRRKELPEVPVFVDGMVRSVCGVYAQHARYVTPGFARELARGGHPFFTGTIQPVRSPKDRKAVLTAGPCILIASSGMLRGGPSAFYAADLAPRAEDAIFITGYQDEESPGRALLNLAEGQGPRTLRLGDQVVDVRCTFATYSLSAHADKAQMIGFLASLGATTQVIVHGDAEAKATLGRGLGTPDVVVADDGMTVERTYAPRTSATPTRTRTLDALRHPAVAAALVGPDKGAPLDMAALAEKWFGRSPTPAERDAFALVLTGMEIVRVDEAGAYWSIVIPELDEDAPLAMELKAQNPKGQLLDLCARRKLPPPKLEARAERGGLIFTAELRLRLSSSEELASGFVRATSRKLAEQLAARALLERLSARGELQAAVDAPEVTASEEEALKAQNPKGHLLEICAKKKWPPPVFAIQAGPNGFVGDACMAVGRALAASTSKRRAPSVKLLEQALAAELLGMVGARLETRELAPTATTLVGPDPRSQLNEMRQAQRLGGFGFELVERRGPPHAPVFVYRGWVVDARGVRHETDALEGASKRDGELAVARALLALVTAPIAPALDR